MSALRKEEVEFPRGRIRKSISITCAGLDEDDCETAHSDLVVEEMTHKECEVMLRTNRHWSLTDQYGWLCPVCIKFKDGLKADFDRALAW